MPDQALRRRASPYFRRLPCLKKCWSHGGLNVYQQKELAEARQASEWLRVGSSSVQQAALRDLDRAFQNWWKNPGHFGHPTWRRAGVHEGFYIRDLSVRRLNRKWGEIQV